MTDKTVSVVMATYNGEKYIREQLDSIIAQTYPIYELIIQDDGSRDRTMEICQEYAKRYAFIHIYQNEHNLGCDKNFETAAMRATGDFVALSDQDDIWFKDKIAKQVAAIGDNDACGSQHMRGKTMEASHLIDPQHLLEGLMFCAFAGHSLLLRRDFIQQPSTWSLPVAFDWGIEVNAQLGRGLTMVEEPLNWHRDNEDSACHVANRQRGVTGKKERLRPYYCGFANYRRLQQKPAWKTFYSHIHELSADKPRLALAHRISGCMLSTSLPSLLKLCLLCLKNGSNVYASKGQSGLMGKVRAFCYPFIFAYQNYNFEQQ